MLREEGDVERDHRGPEMDLACGFVVHHTRPLGRPVIEAHEDTEQRTCDQHVMEVRNHEVGVVHLRVDGHHGQHQASETAQGEHENEAHGEQHGSFKRHGTAPHGGHPVEHLHARGNGDQHGGVHEEQLSGRGHARGEHVVRPDQEGQDGDGGRGIHHRAVAEQTLAGEGRDDGADNTEDRQNHHVHLGVAEEPEQMLIEHRVTAAGGTEETGAEVAVSQGHGDGASQHRHDGQQQVGGDQPGPDEQRHFHQRHARGAQIENGHDDVDRTHDRRSAHEVDGENHQIHAHTLLQGERGIQRPAHTRGAAWHEERGRQQNACGNQQPEAEVVQPREGHVGGTDLQRNHPVGKTHQRGHDRTEDHHDAVHGAEGVEQLRVQQPDIRLPQLGANRQGQNASLEQHPQGKQQIHRADVFVVGGHQPTAPAVRMFVGMITGVSRWRCVIDDCAHSAFLSCHSRKC